MLSRAIRTQHVCNAAPLLPPLTVGAQKKDLGKCFLSPLLTRSTEGGTRTLTPLRELDFESSASADSATSALRPLSIAELLSCCNTGNSTEISILAVPGDRLQERPGGLKPNFARNQNPLRWRNQVPQTPWTACRPKRAGWNHAALQRPHR